MRSEYFTYVQNKLPSLFVHLCQSLLIEICPLAVVIVNCSHFQEKYPMLSKWRAGPFKEELVSRRGQSESESPCSCCDNFSIFIPMKICDPILWFQPSPKRVPTELWHMVINNDMKCNVLQEVIFIQIMKTLP